MRVKRIITLYLHEDDAWDGVDTSVERDEQRQGEIARVTSMNPHGIARFVHQRLHIPMTFGQASAVVPADCCLCEATEEGEYVGWVACPKSQCERPDHYHDDVLEPK